MAVLGSRLLMKSELILTRQRVFGQQIALVLTGPWLPVWVYLCMVSRLKVSHLVAPSELTSLAGLASFPSTSSCTSVAVVVGVGAGAGAGAGMPFCSRAVWTARAPSTRALLLVRTACTALTATCVASMARKSPSTRVCDRYVSAP
jgi:hypothetical protein